MNAAEEAVLITAIRVLLDEQHRLIERVEELEACMRTLPHAFDEVGARIREVETGEYR